MMMKQFLLFEESYEEKMLREISDLKEKHNNLRKGQHARISKLQGKIENLESELEFLKSKICKEGLFL